MPKSPLTLAITRRRFTVAAAAAATGALLPARDAHAQSAATPPQAQADPMSKLSPEARAEVETKVSEIFRKYGSRLSEEQKADIRKVMAETQDGLEKMRAFVLANGDQPATVFKYTVEEKAGSHA